MAKPKKTIDLQVFELKQSHIDLLKRASIHMFHWHDYEQVVGFGGKRPFGNSDVLRDMAEILGRPIPDFDEGEDWSEEFQGEMELLYGELQYALSIVLTRRAFDLGTYYTVWYMNEWFTAEELREQGVNI